jgi:hypothetical protein
MSRSTTPNIAAFAPMPSASVRITVAAKPRDFRSVRNAKRTSWVSSSRRYHSEVMATREVVRKEP